MSSPVHVTLVALAVACGGVAEAKSPALAAASFKEKCQRRLESRRALPPLKARDFCECFLDEARKKYTAVELDERMDGGADEFFKNNLKDETQFCQRKMEAAP